MTLIPPLALREQPRHTIATSYGIDPRLTFQAPCPCGEGPVTWVATRSDNATARPVYDIACTTPEAA